MAVDREGFETTCAGAASEAMAQLDEPPELM